MAKRVTITEDGQRFSNTETEAFAYAAAWIAIPNVLSMAKRASPSRLWLLALAGLRVSDAPVGLGRSQEVREKIRIRQHVPAHN